MFALVALAELCLSLAVRPEIFIGEDTARASQPSLALAARPRSIEDRASLAQVENDTCPSKADLRSWLQELGFRGEGDPCEWQGVTCEEGCYVKGLWSEDRTDIVGNLAPLRHLTRLESLLLPKTQVSGDISQLQSLTRLSELHLSQTQVSGDLAGLQHLTGLRSLYLSQTHVSGDLDRLRNLTQLWHLSLDETQVFGDLGFLQNFFQLSKLDLSQTRVSGDLRHLQGLKLEGRLAFFYVSQTHLWGDLRPLQTYLRLTRLDVSRTQVSGDLGPLASVTRMKTMNLSHTLVSGDLGALQNLTQVKSLDISQTQVSGDLHPLQSLTQLQVLHLSHSQISGDLGPLRRLRELRDLDVSNSFIAGELSALVNLTALQTADLSRTNITGWFSHLWHRKCPHLRTLNLAASKAGGQFDSLNLLVSSESGESWSSSWLPSLQFLDVSGCEMNVTVTDALLPLVVSPIVQIDARSCGLRGEVPPLGELVRMGLVKFGVDDAAGQKRWVLPSCRYTKHCRALTCQGTTSRHLRSCRQACKCACSRTASPWSLPQRPYSKRSANRHSWTSPARLWQTRRT